MKILIKKENILESIEASVLYKSNFNRWMKIMKKYVITNGKSFASKQMIVISVDMERLWKANKKQFLTRIFVIYFQDIARESSMRHEGGKVVLSFTPLLHALDGVRLSRCQWMSMTRMTSWIFVVCATTSLLKNRSLPKQIFLSCLENIKNLPTSFPGMESTQSDSHQKLIKVILQ